MIKKLITITSVIALSCCFFGCKSDEEKCLEDHNAEACKKVYEKEMEELNKNMDKVKKDFDDEFNKAVNKAQKDLDNIKLP